MNGLADIVLVLIVLVAIWFVFILPYQMARRRNRSGILWVLIGLVGSPFLAILLLFAVGNK